MTKSSGVLAAARQRIRFGAHLLKAITRQHHGELRPLFRRLTPRDGTVIDVGAHAGQFSKLFARLVPDGHVHAVEPGRYARRILEPTLRWHRLSNVTVHALALSDRIGDAGLIVPVKATGSIGFGLSHLDHSGGAGGTESVPTTTLDALVEALGLDRVDLIKVDIEGGEAHLLRGARAVLCRHRPALVLELVEPHLARAGSSPREVWDMLAGLGYRGQWIGPDGQAAPPGPYRGDGDYLFRIQEDGATP